MNEKLEKIIRYWKDSLEDSSAGEFDVNNIPSEEKVLIYDFEPQNDVITDPEKIRLLFSLASAAHVGNEEYIDVLVSPVSIGKSELRPFLYPVRLRNDGRLLPPSGDCHPLMLRKYLTLGKRLDRKYGREKFTVGRMKAYENLLKKEVHFEDFGSYIGYICKCFKKITGRSIRANTFKKLELGHDGYLIINTNRYSAVSHIIKLYNTFLNSEPNSKEVKSTALFRAMNRKFINSPITFDDGEKALNECAQKHFGHFSKQYPLSDSQRRVIEAVCGIGANDPTIVVSGPPGTGKTTLIQNIMAQKVVETFFRDKGYYPFIIASASTNQAVTNIIDSFAGQEKENRHILPGYNGYATYLPSDKAYIPKNCNYQTLHGEGIFLQMENMEYITSAKEYISMRFTGEKNMDIEDLEQKFRYRISTICMVLKRLFSLRAELVDLDKQYANMFLKPSSFEINSSFILGKTAEELRHAYFLLKTELFSQSLFQELGTTLGIKKSLDKRTGIISGCLADITVDELKDFIRKKAFKPRRPFLKEIKKALDVCDKYLPLVDSFSAIESRIKQTFPEFYLETYSEFKKKSNTTIYDKLSVFDTSLRARAFDYSVAALDCRWIREMSEYLTRKETDMRRLWEIRSLISPVFVCTFHMAPAFFSENATFVNRYGKEYVKKIPLLGAATMYIVDEAGQTTPEIGVTALMMSKQALIIGDEKQIEPISLVDGYTDKGNLPKFKSKELKTLQKNGFLSSDGNFIRMAKRITTLRDPVSSIDGGFQLLEHRRCRKDIIEYCNEVSYNGELVPMRKEDGVQFPFPAMSYVNVKGQSRRKSTSRANDFEAQAIAEWLRDNRDTIEKFYQSSLPDCVCIITPFKEQAYAIKEKIRTVTGMPASRYKIGTVHSMQGAERPIVLFSLVYTARDGAKMFFDENGHKANLLNVAVSRAKDSFIMFCDAQQLRNQSPLSSSGVLAKHLKIS